MKGNLTANLVEAVRFEIVEIRRKRARIRIRLGNNLEYDRWFEEGESYTGSINVNHELLS